MSHVLVLTEQDSSTRVQAVHSGADLNASAKAAAGALPGAVKGYLGYVQAHQGDHIILPLVENAVEARTELAGSLTGNRCGQRARLSSGSAQQTRGVSAWASLACVLKGMRDHHLLTTWHTLGREPCLSTLRQRCTICQSRP